MTFHYYDKQTGLLIGRTAASTDPRIAPTEIEGLDVIEGDFDHLSQRVDLETLQVVDYQPPQPSDDHEWDDAVKRWALKPEVLEAQQKAAEAVAAIAAQEATQDRPVRELVLELLADETVRARLSEKGAVALAKLQAVDAAAEAERPKIAEKGNVSG